MVLLVINAVLWISVRGNIMLHMYGVTTLAGKNLNLKLRILYICVAINLEKRI